MKYNENQRFKAVKDIGWRKVEEEVFIISTKGNAMIHALNDTGGMIWEFMQAGRTFGEICGKLMDEFEVDMETLEKDLGEFFAALVTSGVVIKTE